MKCKVIFNINGTPVELEHDFDSAGPLIDQDILTVLEENPDKLTEIAQLLYDTSLNWRNIKNVSLTSLRNMNGLVGNCTIDFLMQQPAFSGITFLDTSANVLLLNNVSIGKTNIKGRIINSQGQELFVIGNDREDVIKLASFLNTRKHLQESELLIDPNSVYREQMEQIMQQRNKKSDPVKDYSELLLDFIYNKSKYHGIYIDNKSAISILSNIYKNIKDWTLPTSYNDPFINDLNTDLVSLASLNKSNNTNKFKGDYFVSYDRLYDLIKNYHPNVLKALEVTSLKKFKELLNKNVTDIEEQLRTVVDIEDSVPASILHTLFNSEPDFTYVFSRLSKNGVILHHEYETLESKYGIGYDTISSMDIIEDNYRGYKIYRQIVNDKPRFFISRGYLTEQNNSNSFDTQEEASTYIDNSLNFQNLNKNSLIEFKLQNSTTNDNGEIVYENSINLNSITTGISFTEGQVIEVLDVPISKSTIIVPKEVSVLSKRLSDFQKLVRSWDIEEGLKQNIISSMNTPEKAVTFIYKVNEQLGDNRENTERINEIYEQISNAKVKYYYIDKKTIGKDKFTYRVIPTTPNDVVNYQKSIGKNIPIVTWMGIMRETLQSQFPGLKINLLPATYIKELQICKDGLVDPNTDKAFIYNGQIYVNTTIAKSTDLLHEYVHIILGCLKTNPDLVSNYEQLMRLVADSTEGKKLSDVLRLSYPNISEIDLMEEIFAKLFSDWVRGRVTPGAKKVFNATEKEISDITESVFNTKIGDLREFYTNNVISIFTKFNKEVAKLLQDTQIDYNQIGLGRKYSNYISQQIKEGKIQEEC